MAVRQLDVGAVTAAQRWIAWAAWLDPSDGRADLIQATCFRRLKQVHRFIVAIESAKRKGAPAMQIQQELQLGLIEAGDVDTGTEHRIGALIESGLPPHEVAAAYVYGFLVRRQPEEARKVLDAWAADAPEDGHVAYMTGVYWQWLGEPTQAQREYELALARQPRHELACIALAELLEEQDRFEEAFQRYLEAATRFPASETAQAGVARMLRTVGRIDEARAVLRSPSPESETPSAIAAEMAQIELESANYEVAGRWFQQAVVDQTEDRVLLRSAATQRALMEDVAQAARLLARVDSAIARLRRIDDLRIRLTIDPRDKAAKDELDRLSRPSQAGWAQLLAPRTGEGGEEGQPNLATSAADLYALHCSACHGDNGRGDGRAARHLFPRPRDLRTDRSRLVSTVNGIPTLEDLEAVIRLGMPGTAMRAFDQLADDQRRKLAEETLRLNREGLREHLVDVLTRQGEKIDEDEIREVVAIRTKPGPAVQVPSIGAADSRAIAKGNDGYFELKCHDCHGRDGVGAWDIPLFDDNGLPSAPRDLVHEPFKGGHEPEAIYLRLLLGMPGTPHPSCATASEEQLVNLVQYCRQMSREPKRFLTNHERASQVAGRAYMEPRPTNE